MKKLMKIVVILIIICVVLVLGRNVILKGAVENGVSLVTGLGLSMRTFRLGIIDSSLRIQELKIYNPKNYQEPIMLDMPEIFVDYNVGDIIKGKVHLESLVINLQKFNIVKNKDGELNLDSLKVVKEGKEKEKKPAPEKPKKKGKAPKFQLDNLDLAVGTISFMDYSGGAEPKVNDYKFNIKEQHKDISNPQVIMGIIIQKALLKASIAKISGFDLGGIQGAMNAQIGDLGDYGAKALEGAKELSGGVLEKVESLPESVEGVKDIGGKTVETAEEASKKAVSVLKGLGGKIKNPLSDE